MIYNFTYFFGNKLLRKTCTTMREAEVFFDILVSAGLPFRVVTFGKRGHYYG